jgi:hypothetical protein
MDTWKPGSRTSPGPRGSLRRRSITTSAARKNIDGLRKVLAAGWEFWSTHPDEARLVARYSEGPTQHALELRQEWEERHLQRAYDYMPAVRSSGSARKAREQHAAHTMAIRVMLDVILITQATVLEGKTSRVARGPLVAAVEEMCISLIMSLT